MQDDIDYRKSYIKTLQAMRDTNKKTKFGDNTSGNKRYIITELMKMKGYEIKEYNKSKLIRYMQKREIEDYKPWQEEEENRRDLGKDLMTDYIKYGDYIGTTTEQERKNNQERKEAKALGVSIKTLRLIKKGIITNI